MYFFIWNINKSIIIGSNQLLESEVDYKKALNKGFKIYRRPSGGGAICADEGCFMFTFITKMISKDDAYHFYLTRILDILKSLKLDAYLSGRNDLMFMNKKFSGNSIYFQNNKTILHGTFLFNANLDLIDELLVPSSLKLESKGIKSVKERVINLKSFLPFGEKYELMDYINNNIDENITFISLNLEELKLVNEYKTLFEDHDYIYNDAPPFTYKNKKKYHFGLIEVYIFVTRGIINEFRLVGDFFNLASISDLESKFINKKYQDILSIACSIKISDYIDNMTNEEFIDLLGGENGITRKENNSL